MDPLSGLASRWAELSPLASRAVADRLATVLRKLATVLHAEPYRPAAARDLGVELIATGLCGDPRRPLVAAEDVLPDTLALLRDRAAGALGVTAPEMRGRLTAALDEMAAGFARALGEQGRAAPSPAPAGVDSGLVVPAHLYRDLYEQCAVGMAFATLDGHVIDANPALCRMLDIAALEQQRPLSDFIHPDDLADVVERHQRLVRAEPATMQLEVRLVRPDSSVRWVHMAASLVRRPDGSPSHMMAVVEDISHRQQVRSRLQHASARDQLTRLPGQAVAEQWLHRAYGPDGLTRVGICAFDLDGFQAVNDDLGDDVADRLLLGVAGRLQLAAGAELVTRTGSDEFTVFVADPVDVEQVCRFADRLQAALATPFVIGSHEITISASIGVSEAPTARSCPAELQRCADVARSWATAMGGARRVVFDHKRDAGEATRFALLRGLRSGIARNEFRVLYQPLVRLSDRRLAGVEALVRWQHPDLGLIGPGRFIELAEHSGAIVPLGRWVLETACRQAASWWRELGDGAPYVSVNVSPVQLAEPAWLDEVTQVLAETGLPAHLLQLEITEQAVLGDETSMLDALTALRAAGVRIALDDFGTGYSSLAWLRRLPVHALKIDGSFVQGLRGPTADPVDSSIVWALIEMAHALGLDVTAEWVETEGQAERLTELGCDAGQGRWFGDAGPGEWVPELWRRSIRS